MSVIPQLLILVLHKDSVARSPFGNKSRALINSRTSAGPSLLELVIPNASDFDEIGKVIYRMPSSGYGDGEGNATGLGFQSPGKSSQKELDLDARFNIAKVLATSKGEDIQDRRVDGEFSRTLS